MNMRLRLILAFTLVVVVAILAVVMIVRTQVDTLVRNFMYRGGMVGAQALVDRLETYYQDNGGWEGVEFLMEGRGQGVGMGMGRGMGMMMRQRIRLAAPSGRILYDSDPTGTEYPGLSPEEMKSAIMLQDTNGATIGYLQVAGGMNVLQGDIAPLLQGLNNAGLQAGGIALAIALLLALALASGLLRPIRNLTIAAEHLTAGDLDTRVPVKGNDELATLGRAFNKMTTSLQESENRRKEMTADIAHELRTPLAVQRAHLEALQDGIYPLTPENLQPVLDQNEMLTRLVEDLRTLAMADAGELRLEHVWVDIAELIDRLLAQFRATAEARKINLGMQAGEEANCPKVWGDPLRLEQILNNLISNAIRHAPDEGSVTIESHCQEDWVEIRVHDTGAGIPEEALLHVFERFYRADRSRTRDEGGSGLGLTIARQLALTHDGTLIAENHPEGGAVFILRLPILPAGESTEME